MRQARLLLLIAAIAQLIVGCEKPKPHSQTPMAKPSAEHERIAKALQSWQKAVDKALAPYEGDLGWAFYVSDGKDGIAFHRSFSGEYGEWDAKPFTGKKPPYVFDCYDATKLTLQIEINKDVPSLKLEEITPELAEPAKKAIRLTKLMPRLAPLVWIRLDRDAAAALSAVAHGKMRVQYLQQPLFGMIEEKLYYGADAYPVWKISLSGAPNGSERMEIVLLPDGFLVTWNNGYLPSVAFELKGDSLTAIPQWQAEEPLDVPYAQEHCVMLLNRFMQTAQCASILRDCEMDIFKDTVNVFQTKKPKVMPECYFKYINELFIQLIEKPESAPPKVISGDDNPITANYDLETDEFAISYKVYKNGHWDMALFKGDFRDGMHLSVIQYPNGIGSGYLDGSSLGANLIGYSQANMALRRLPSESAETAVKSIGLLAKEALTTKNLHDNLPPVIEAELTQLIQRKMCLLDWGDITALMYELVTAEDGEMIYELGVPGLTRPRITYRITKDNATIDKIQSASSKSSSPSASEAVWQVAFEDGKFKLTIPKSDASPQALIELRETIRTTAKLKAAGLITVPSFAEAMLKELETAIGVASKFDAVISMPAKDIKSLEPITSR